MCKYTKILDKVYMHYDGNECKDLTAYDECTRLFCILHNGNDYCDCWQEQIKRFLFKLFVVNYRKLKYGGFFKNG